MMQDRVSWPDTSQTAYSGSDKGARPAIRSELSPAVSSASRMAAHAVPPPLLIKGREVMVAVIPSSTWPVQSKIAALEAALRCLGDSLQEARLQEDPGRPDICSPPCGIPHHDVVVLNAGADDCGPAVVVYHGLKEGFLPQAIPQEQGEEMPPYVGAWREPNAPPFRQIQDQRIFVVMNLLMHTAALLFALSARERNEAYNHPDLEVKEGEGKRGQYQEDFAEVAYWHMRRMNDMNTNIHAHIICGVQKAAGFVFEGTGHPLDRPLSTNLTKREFRWELFDGACYDAAHRIKTELFKAKRQKTQ